MWLAPYRRRVSSARSASAWLARARAAAPNSVTLLAWPGRPNGRRWITSPYGTPVMLECRTVDPEAGRQGIRSGDHAMSPLSERQSRRRAVLPAVRHAPGGGVPGVRRERRAREPVL